MELIGYLPDLPEEATMHVLLAALRPEIKMEVIRSAPQSTEDLIISAIEAEDLQRECSISQEKSWANRLFQLKQD